MPFRDLWYTEENANPLEFGRKAIDRSARPNSNVYKQRPVARSQTLASHSPDDARRVESGEKASDRIGCICPSSVCKQQPVNVFQILML